jgi:hypothetical protein
MKRGAENDDVGRAEHVFTRSKIAPRRRGDAEHTEEFRRHPPRGDARSFAAPRQIDAARSVPGHAGERMVLVANVEELVGRRRDARKIHGAKRSMNVEERVGLGEGQRPKDDCVEHAEHGRHSADRKRQGRDDRRRVRLHPGEAFHGEARVLAERDPKLGESRHGALRNDPFGSRGGGEPRETCTRTTIAKLVPDRNAAFILGNRTIRAPRSLLCPRNGTARSEPSDGGVGWDLPASFTPLG